MSILQDSGFSTQRRKSELASQQQFEDSTLKKGEFIPSFSENKRIEGEETPKKSEQGWSEPFKEVWSEAFEKEGEKQGEDKERLRRQPQEGTPIRQTKAGEIDFDEVRKISGVGDIQQNLPEQQQFNVGNIGQSFGSQEEKLPEQEKKTLGGGLDLSMQRSEGTKLGVDDTQKTSGIVGMNEGVKSGIDDDDSPKTYDYLGGGTTLGVDDTQKTYDYLGGPTIGGTKLDDTQKSSDLVGGTNLGVDDSQKSTSFMSEEQSSSLTEPLLSGEHRKLDEGGDKKEQGNFLMQENLKEKDDKDTLFGKKGPAVPYVGGGDNDKISQGKEGENKNIFQDKGFGGHIDQLQPEWEKGVFKEKEDVKGGEGFMDKWISGGERKDEQVDQKEQQQQSVELYPGWELKDIKNLKSQGGVLGGTEDIKGEEVLGRKEEKFDQKKPIGWNKEGQGNYGSTEDIEGHPVLERTKGRQNIFNDKSNISGGERKEEKLHQQPPGWEKEGQEDIKGQEVLGSKEEEAEIFKDNYKIPAIWEPSSSLGTQRTDQDKGISGLQQQQGDVKENEKRLAGEVDESAPQQQKSMVSEQEDPQQAQQQKSMVSEQEDPQQAQQKIKQKNEDEVKQTKSPQKKSRRQKRYAAQQQRKKRQSEEVVQQSSSSVPQQQTQQQQQQQSKKSSPRYHKKFPKQKKQQENVQTPLPQQESGKVEEITKAYENMKEQQGQEKEQREKGMHIEGTQGKVEETVSAFEDKTREHKHHKKHHQHHKKDILDQSKQQGLDQGQVRGLREGGEQQPR